MPSRTSHRTGVRIAGCLLLLAGASQAQAPKGGHEGSSEVDRNRTHTLDLSNRTLVQRIGSELAEPMAQKFVQIEITDVVNPKRIPVTFDVHYRPEKGEQILLGSFGLFPPDNPGKFIVATGGKLRNEGAIVLSMVVLQETQSDDHVRVRVKRISFRKS